MWQADLTWLESVLSCYGLSYIGYPAAVFVYAVFNFAAGRRVCFRWCVDDALPGVLGCASTLEVRASPHVLFIAVLDHFPSIQLVVHGFPRVMARPASRISRYSKDPRVESGRVWEFSKPADRAGSPWPDPTGPARSDLTRKKPWFMELWCLRLSCLLYIAICDILLFHMPPAIVLSCQELFFFLLQPVIFTPIKPCVLFVVICETCFFHACCSRSNCRLLSLLLRAGQAFKRRVNHGVVSRQLLQYEFGNLKNGSTKPDTSVYVQKKTVNEKWFHL